MNRYRMFCFTLTLLTSSLFVTDQVKAFEDGYGSITGQYVLDGKVPEREILIKKGDTKAKDAAVCSAQNVPTDSLVIDPKTKGIQHIFVYLRKKPAKVHPDLKETPEKDKEVLLDQKGCRFVPHTLVLRTDQTVRVKSADNCAHNTHTYPFRNQPVNFLLAGNDREGLVVKNRAAERLPFQVKCDIHPWMIAWWLTLDHPYAVVTDEKGNFTIEKLPAGEYEFTAWHERVGYLGSGTRRGFKVTVEPGKQTRLETVKLPLAKFSDN